MVGSEAMTLRKEQESRHYQQWEQWEDKQEESYPTPWSQEQVEAWRIKNPSQSPWQLIRFQLAALIVMVLLTAMLDATRSVMISVAYGGLCVVVPAVLFWRGVRQRRDGEDIRKRMIKFVVWELAKIVLTIAMLIAAPKLIAELNWLALVASFVVTMKLSWLALLIMSKQGR
jgi:ATP synthase protein I